MKTHVKEWVLEVYRLVICTFDKTNMLSRCFEQICYLIFKEWFLSRLSIGSKQFIKLCNFLNFLLHLKPGRKIYYFTEKTSILMKSLRNFLFWRFSTLSCSYKVRLMDSSQFEQVRHFSNWSFSVFFFFEMHEIPFYECIYYSYKQGIQLVQKGPSKQHFRGSFFSQLSTPCFQKDIDC